MAGKLHDSVGRFILGVFIAIAPGCADRAFYYPDSITYLTPEEKGIVYEDVFFLSGDGTRLHGWFVPALGDPVGTVIHFHGNAQNLTSHFSFVDWLPARGFNLFTFDYRGYGRSEGKPNRRGVYEDCIAAITYVLARRDIDSSRVVILGQSLGGANALAVLGRNTFPGIQAVAVDSAFYSYRAIVRDKIGDIPILSLVKRPLSFAVASNGLSPGEVVGAIAPVPILFLHGTADRVVPYNHTTMLYAKAQEPKFLMTLEGGDHMDALTDDCGECREALVDFFGDALDGGPKK